MITLKSFSPVTRHFKCEVGGLIHLGIILYNSVRLRSCIKDNHWHFLRENSSLKLKGIIYKIENIGMVVFPGQLGKAKTTFLRILVLVYDPELKLLKTGICMEYGR